VIHGRKNVVQEFDAESQLVIDALSKILSEAMEESERYERELPHLMICTDLTTGYMTFSGPFSDRGAAQQIALRESHNLGADGPFIFRVAPLYPPLELRGSLPAVPTQIAPTERRPRVRRLRAADGCGSLGVDGGPPLEPDSDELG
jgi:hypothetical protein